MQDPALFSSPHQQACKAGAGRKRNAQTSMKPPFSEADKVLQQSKTVRITWTWSLASIGNTSAISHNHKRIDPFRGKVGKV